MNLIKNVDGDWALAKSRVRQDLDTIQRTLNDLQAALAALTTQVNTVVAIPAATIAPSGKVTAYVPPLIEPKRTVTYLSSVATNGGLTGDGTVTNPLIASGSTVSVAAAGALTGDGSVGNPLSVNVDNSTITIVGNNLQANASAIITNPLLVTTGGISTAQVNANTTITLAAGVSSKVLIPQFIAIHSNQPNTFGTSRGFIVKYNDATGPTFMTTANVVVGGGGTQNVHLLAYPNDTNVADATLDPAGKAVVGTFGGTNTAGASLTCTWTFGYIAVAV